MYTAKGLIAEAKRVQSAFFEISGFWSLTSCLDSLLEKGIEATQTTIDEAKKLAQEIDDAE